MARLDRSWSGRHRARRGGDGDAGGEPPEPRLEPPHVPPAPPPPSSSPSSQGRSRPETAEERRRRGLSSWVEKRATKVVSRLYRTQADDLEERATRAMRRAIADEADRIKEVIEHSVSVKKREVRLSLLVLITAALVYFALDWIANGPKP